MNQDPHLKVTTRCVDRPAIFKPGQTRGWDAIGKAFQTDGFVENNGTFSRSRGANGWRNWKDEKDLKKEILAQ